VKRDKRVRRGGGGRQQLGKSTVKLRRETGEKECSEKKRGGGSHCEKAVGENVTCVGKMEHVRKE